MKKRGATERAKLAEEIAWNTKETQEENRALKDLLLKSMARTRELEDTILELRKRMRRL